MASIGAFDVAPVGKPPAVSEHSGSCTSEMKCAFPEPRVLLCGCADRNSLGTLQFVRLDLQGGELAFFRAAAVEPDRWDWQPYTHSLVLVRQASQATVREELSDRGSLLSTERIQGGTFSPDGTYYESGGVFEVASGRRISVAGDREVPPRWPVYTWWSPLGRWLYLRTENPIDGVQRNWVVDLLRRRASGALACRPGGGTRVSWSSDGSRWAMADACDYSDDSPVVWDNLAGRRISVAPLPFDLGELALDPTGQRLVVRGRAGDLAIVDIVTGAVHRLDAPAARCHGLPSWSPTGRFLACIDANGDALAIGVAGMAARTAASAERPGTIAWSSDDALIAVTVDGRSHVLHTSGTGRVLSVELGGDAVELHDSEGGVETIHMSVSDAGAAFSRLAAGLASHLGSPP